MPRIELRADDGHAFSAYRIDPEGTPRGGVVVVQEIFGVNAHIRAVTVRFAALGYSTIAPAIFDRAERGVELGYDEEGFTRGRALAGQLSQEGLRADLRAAIAAVSKAGAEGNRPEQPPMTVGMVGYCFGGALAWAAAAQLAALTCVVSYYGSRILGLRELVPKVPVQMHVGRTDASFPVEQVREIAAAHAGVELHEYDAGHGFDCDHRKDFEPDASAAALQRTLAFFARHLG
jgi:carboxymethylenebutenolidase